MIDKFVVDQFSIGVIKFPNLVTKLFLNGFVVTNLK